MKRATYCYIIKLKWRKGEVDEEYQISICSSLKTLRSILLDVILDLQNKYVHVEQDYNRHIVGERTNREYHKSFDDVLKELKQDGFSSMIKYHNAPEKYEGTWDDEHLAYELTIEKQLMNSWHNPIPDIAW